MEISSGLKDFTKLNVTLKTLLPFVSFFLGFSSLSIIFQVFSCVYINNFKLKNILKGKLMHGILSFIITYILVNIPYVYESINISKEVNINLEVSNIAYNSLYNNHIFISIIIFILHTLIFTIFILNKKKRLSITT